MEVAQAIQLIIQAGLMPVVQYAPNASVPFGQIIPGSQSPPAGTQLQPGTAFGQALGVSFVVSAGPPSALGLATMPNCVGLPALAARNALQAVNLSLDNAAWVVSATAPEGTVVTQNIQVPNPTPPPPFVYAPAIAGNTYPCGSIIQLILSAGPQRVPQFGQPFVSVPAVS